MAIYSFWIFDRHCKFFSYWLEEPCVLTSFPGNCIYSREWTPLTIKVHIPQQQQSLKQSGGSINARNEDHSAKLLFGALFSLKQMSSKLNPSPTLTNKFKSFSTAKYRCHFFETGSGLKFCLLTDPIVENMHFALKEIYTNLFLNCVVKK